MTQRFAHSLVCLLACLSAVCRAQAPPSYTITTIAGTTPAGQGGCNTTTTAGSYSGDGGAATSAGLNGPAGMVFDSNGNLVFADSFNNRVREINTSGTISTVAGNGTAGFAGDGSSATASGTELNSPSGLAFDSSGNLYIADTGNYEIRKVAGGNISTFAGDNGLGAGFSGNLGPASVAQLYNPSGVAVDSAGNVYIADPGNDLVRIVCQNQTPIACNSNAFSSVTFAAGDINTFAGGTDVNGVGVAGYLGDNGPATASLLYNPQSVTMDQAGNLYIVDSGNNAIRKVTPNGTITTVVGDGSAANGYSGDGGPATSAEMDTPKALAVDSNGYLYIADTNNFRVRAVAPDGTIYTIAGKGNSGFSGDGGPATSAEMCFPAGIAVNGSKIYVADSENNVIRLLTPVPRIPAVNAGGVITASSFGASTTVSPGSWIEIYGTNLASSMRTWGSSDFNGSNAPTSLDKTSVTVGGKPAYPSYISPGQVNVQVPSGIANGTQPLVVTTPSGASASYNLAIGNAPALYAPSIFNIGGKQYAGALIANSTTWVLPAGAVSGLTSRPASPGDYITLYGVGFGTVTPDVPAGQLVGATEQPLLTSQVQFLIGTTPVTPSYQGLAPGYVGLYQFNFQVPEGVTAGDAVPLTFTQGGVSGTQTLYIAIGN